MRSRPVSFLEVPGTANASRLEPAFEPVSRSKDRKRKGILAFECFSQMCVLSLCTSEAPRVCSVITLLKQFYHCSS